MDLESIYHCFLKHPVITTDSRNVTAGSIFFALRGDNFNGNNFALNALESGAAYAVVDEPALPQSDKLIRVENSLDALQQLSKMHRQKMKATVLAITGSNGKTTTKELCAAVLSKKFNTVFTQGNLNNHIGVPLTLLRIKPETKMAIIEMGANHMGEIRQLCLLAEPHYGIITNIGKAHLEGFGSFTGVINAKTELYNYIDDHKGMLFVNRDNELLDNQSKNIRRFSFGKAMENDLYGELVAVSPFLSLIWEYKGMQSVLKTQMIGTYNLENILVAIATGCYFGLEKEAIDKAIQAYVPSNNRSQLLHTKRNKLVLDAYNANPSSMAEAIRNFDHIRENKALYILGDMLELGHESQHEHAAILKLLSDMDAKNVILVGNEFKKVYRGDDWEIYDDVESLNLRLKNKALKGFDILIKGSRGIKLEKTVDFL